MVRVAAALSMALGVWASDCGNGNECADGTTCVGPHVHTNMTGISLVGRKYGCAPFPQASVCRGGRFSCPAGTTCSTTRAGSVCLKPDSSFAGNVTSNVASTATPAALAAVRARGEGGCEVIGSSLPSECTCQDATLFGGTIDCQEYLVLDTVGVRGELLPCAEQAHARYSTTNPTYHSSPAIIWLLQFGLTNQPTYLPSCSLTIYETDAGFSYSKSIGAGTEIAQFPIPGLSIGVPGIGDCGVFAGVTFEGNAESLTLDGTLDLCGEVAGVKACGSDVYSGLPVDVISGTWDFSSVCDSGVAQK
jgi:hypothetical protein